MTGRSIRFGPELRRRRMAAGLSLIKFAARVNYTKGYLSKIETGEKPPTLDLARRCDAELDAGGTLVALVTPARPRPAGRSGPVQPLPALSEPPLSGPPTGWPAHDPEWAAGLREAAVPESALTIFGAMFEQHRLLGHQASPNVVLPGLAAQASTLQALAGQTDDAELAGRLLRLTARYAEYAGWMAQEAGDDRAAMEWTGAAVTLATASGDADLARYALVRAADIALYRDDAVQTIELARRAQADPDTAVGIRALAAQREAQGHAMAGAEAACRSALERAAGLLPAGPPGTRPAFGSTSLADPIAITTGWALHDLGRSKEAAEILDREVPRIPATAARSRARYGIRQALAHAVAGNLEIACALTATLLPDAVRADSATIRVDLRRLARSLVRWRSDPAVRELYPRLTAALHTGR
ncbi:MAG TPA: helix-turn-helix domain-containing protein [Mycobacteriales bacterium]|nr:helix-turn-helix domain-containing protein [Mycobacteriales bacterium]